MEKNALKHTANPKIVFSIKRGRNGPIFRIRPCFKVSTVGPNGVLAVTFNLELPSASEIKHVAG